MKRLPLAAGLVLAVGWTAPALGQAASKFDLVCTGVREPFGQGEAEADSRRYTIDLAAKRWCRTTECKEGLPIEKVTADEITFRRSEPGEMLEHRHFVSRVTGEYVEHVFMSITSTGSRATGTCRPAAFSGLPKAKF